MDINEVSKRSGLPASSLRFYEEKGLIQSVGRRGLRRLFDSDILQKLSLIALGQDSGFTLEEIALMFSEDGVLNINRKKLIEKADEINFRIKRLSAMRNGLLHAAECPARSHLECPTFQRLMKISGQKFSKRRKK